MADGLVGGSLPDSDPALNLVLGAQGAPTARAEDDVPAIHAGKRPPGRFHVDAWKRPRGRYSQEDGVLTAHDLSAGKSCHYKE